MGRSKEFDRDGDADVKDVLTKAGPLGILPILCIAASLLIIIVALVWWIA